MGPKRHENKDLIDYIKDNCPCVVHMGNCSDDVEVHHIKSRGAGGGDFVWNCLPTCRIGHTNIHSIGLVKAAETFPGLKKWLVLAGWEYDTKRDKWQFYGKEDGE